MWAEQLLTKIYCYSNNVISIGTISETGFSILSSWAEQKQYFNKCILIAQSLIPTAMYYNKNLLVQREIL